MIMVQSNPLRIHFFPSTGQVTGNWINNFTLLSVWNFSLSASDCWGRWHPLEYKLIGFEQIDVMPRCLSAKLG